MPKYDFNHLDRFGNPTIKEEPKLQKYAVLMNRMPSRSGYIWFLNNNIDVNTVGNVRYKVRYYYDIYTKQLSEEPTSEETMAFKDVRLKDGSPARCWIYEEDFRKAGWNGR